MARPPAGGRRVWRRHLRLWQLVLPATLFLVVYFVVPLAMLFWWSFRAPGVSGPTLANYQRFLSDRFLLDTLWLSLRLSLEVTLITLVLGFPLAYLYTRLGPPWQLAILFITLLPLLTSAVVRSFGWIVILGKQGLINAALVGSGLVEAPVRLLFTVEGVRLALAQVQLPFMLLPLINVMEQLDPSLEQAAISLGASQARAFWRVTVPLCLPGIMAGAILNFALTISAFITPAMVGGGSFTVMPTLIYQSAIVTLDWATAATTALILLVVALLVVWVGMAVARRYRYGAAHA
ncbi:MAG TPA: ABC transporter permease [Methylomirabilota bacterium]|jgi:putative spermidine/putrescine transport system permease protein|nr:ABC transporter permease [Methylomirabilota bacterium]